MSCLIQRARMGLFMLFATLALAMPALAFARAAAEATPMATGISDAALVATLPGFKEGFADVSGARLHYVAGGKGEVVVLLPGWPATTGGVLLSPAFVRWSKLSSR